MAHVSIGRSIVSCVALIVLVAPVVSGQTQATLNSASRLERAVCVDSEETNQPGYLAPNAIDGDPNTSWATPWYLVPGIHPPHEIQIDMGATHNVVGFRYLPHQGLAARPRGGLRVLREHGRVRLGSAGGGRVVTRIETPRPRGMSRSCPRRRGAASAR